MNVEEALRVARAIRERVLGERSVVAEEDKEKRQEEDQEVEVHVEPRVVMTSRLSFLRAARQAHLAGLLTLDDCLLEQVVGVIAPQLEEEITQPANFDISAIQQAVDRVDFRVFEKENRIS